MLSKREVCFIHMGGVYHTDGWCMQNFVEARELRMEVSFWFVFFSSSYLKSIVDTQLCIEC